MSFNIWNSELYNLDKFQCFELFQVHTIELLSIVIPRSKELGQFQYVEQLDNLILRKKGNMVCLK